MIAGLILAAGESRRMGRDKALLTYRGQTFVDTLVQSLTTAGVAGVTVVLGHHAAEIQRAVNLPAARVAINPDYRHGQTSSQQLGLMTLAPEQPDAVVLCLVDHPAISVEVIAELVRQFESTRAPVLIPTHLGERGHPVIISQALFPELLALTPGEPAHSVIRKYREATQFVEVADPGVLLDVDYPADYAKLGESIRQ